MTRSGQTAVSAPAWDIGGWRPLAPLCGDLQADLCVVGLGGSGLSAAAAALDHGMSVVGVDAAGVAGGAAGRNGGFLLAGLARFYHRTVEQIGRERAARIYQATIDEIARISAAAPDQVRRTGSLRIATTAEERTDCECQFEALRADGFAVERYDGPEGNGLLLPTDAAFDPLGRCRALAQTLAARGARLFERSPAVEIREDGVGTPQGSVRARHVLVAVDGGLDRLLPVGATAVRSARLQMLGTAPTTDIRVPRPVYARWGYEYWQQLDDGRVVLGGFRDTELEHEWTASDAPTPSIQQRLERFLRDVLRVKAPVTHRWAAAVGYTPDGMPVLERTSAGFWAIGGYNGTGNVIGALCARAVIECIDRGTSDLGELLGLRERSANV